MGLFSFFNKSKKEKQKKEIEVKPRYFIIEQGIKKRVSEEEYFEKERKQKQDIEEEYNKNKEIVKIFAEIKDNQFKIKKLDDRKFSDKEIENKKSIILGLLSTMPQKPNGDKSSIFYLHMGEPKITKYLIEDKEISKKEFEEYQKKLKK